MDLVQSLVDSPLSGLIRKSKLRVGGFYIYTVGKKSYPVQIVDGSFLGSSRGICNYWYWRRVLPAGKLGREYHGYDNKGRFRPISRKEALALARKAR